LQNYRSNAVLPMKIAFLSTFYPYRGGIAQFNAALYRAFEASGHTVRAFNFRLQFPGFLFPGTTQYVSPHDRADPIPSTRCLNSINPVSYVQTAQKIRQFAPDLLLVGYFTPYLAPALSLTAWLLRKDKVPRVAILNNLYPHEPAPLQMGLIRFFLGQMDGFMVMGREVEQQLHEQLPDAPKIKFPHPVYRHFGKPMPQEHAKKALNIDPDRRTLLFFGLIRPYKGLDVLLKAFRNLNPGQYQLIIAGEPYEDFGKYRSLLSELPPKSKVVEILRYVDDTEVTMLFSAADLAVLPYKSATQSGVTAIANHFELPVLVTDKGNLKEHVAPFGTGIVAEEASPELIEQGIHAFFQEGAPERYRQNIRKFNTQFTWEALAQKLVGFTKELKTGKR